MGAIAYCFGGSVGPSKTKAPMEMGLWRPSKTKAPMEMGLRRPSKTKAPMEMDFLRPSKTKAPWKWVSGGHLKGKLP